MQLGIAVWAIALVSVMGAHERTLRVNIQTDVGENRSVLMTVAALHQSLANVAMNAPAPASEEAAPAPASGGVHEEAGGKVGDLSYNAMNKLTQDMTENTTDLKQHIQDPLTKTAGSAIEESENYGKLLVDLAGGMETHGKSIESFRETLKTHHDANHLQSVVSILKQAAEDAANGTVTGEKESGDEHHAGNSVGEHAKEDEEDLLAEGKPPENLLSENPLDKQDPFDPPQQQTSFAQNSDVLENTDDSSSSHRASAKKPQNK